MLISKMEAPSMQVKPNSNSAFLFDRTAFILEAINEIEEPKARIVDPAILSDILYLT